MTWTAFRSRGEILRAVASAADSRLDGQLPMDVEGVHERFSDELELLGALQLRWHARLSGRIERELATQPLDLERAVLDAWQGTAELMPGIRAVLDHHRDHPVDAAMADAMRTATTKEHVMLAVTAGRAGLAAPGAARIGAAIEDRARTAYARSGLAHGRPTQAGRGCHAGLRLRDRLRTVLAA